MKNLKTDSVRQRVESDAKRNGYTLNPDSTFLKNLLEGLKQNEERYGYPSCPCRFASGILEVDRDIICPCDYRDPDVQEYGWCYCALFIKNDTKGVNESIQPIPERRSKEKIERSYQFELQESTQISKEKVVHKYFWYCKQCGYMCYREDPPYICPICKAKKELFSKIKMKVKIEG
jgi:ferredoxin-thioredoxin reductase catalytic subunit